MSSSDEDDGEPYSTPPFLRSDSSEAVDYTSTYLPEDDTPLAPVLMPKRSSQFIRSSISLDRQITNVTPIPAPRRLSSSRKQTDGSIEISLDQPADEIRRNIKTTSQSHFSKSLDLMETRDVNNEAFNSKSSGKSESSIYQFYSDDQPATILSLSWPSPNTTTVGGLANTECENSSPKNTNQHCPAVKPVPMDRPIPKPRSKINLISSQSVDLSVEQSPLPVKKELIDHLPIRHSESMIEFQSQFSSESGERQSNYSRFPEQNHNALDLIPNGKVDTKSGLMLERNEINYSGITELVSDINPTASTNGDTHITDDDDDENSGNYVYPDISRNDERGNYIHSDSSRNDEIGHIAHSDSSQNDEIGHYAHSDSSRNDEIGHYVHSDSSRNDEIGHYVHSESRRNDETDHYAHPDIRKGGNSHYLCPDDIGDGLPFVPQNFEAASRLHSPSRPHSIDDDASWYTQMTDKRSPLNKGNSPSRLEPSSHQHHVLHNSDHKPSRSYDIFHGNTSDSDSVPEYSAKGFDFNSIPNHSTQHPFHGIQPFKSNYPLTPHSPENAESQRKIYNNVNTTESDFLWSDLSNPVQIPTKNTFDRPVETSLNNASSDFPVDWESAFSNPEASDTSTFHSPRSRASTEEINGTCELSFSPQTQKRPTAISSFKPQNHNPPFINNAPTHRPPPLPALQNNSPGNPPPPLPNRPNNSSNVYAQTGFQTPPTKKNSNSKPAANTDIFGELPAPAFPQSQSSDPFQDSNFGIECHQFNSNKMPLKPPRTPLREASVANAKVEVSSLRGVETTAACNFNGDPGHLSSFVIPSPNSSELCGNDREFSDSPTPEIPDQGLNDSSGSRRTRLKVFDSSILPKKNARCGYLSKQGGYKANKGWKKRWVVYNGTSLSYYSNNTAQVSKRIIPVKCMVSIETDVKATDKNNFRFKVITSLKDRVFVFSSETLDDCLTWANTLMAAITEHKRSVKSSELPQEKPDIEGFIKFGNMKKYYVTITGKILCYYQSFEDYQMGSPTHEIDMKLASVKMKDHKKLQLWIHYGHFNLTFDSDQEMQQWRLAMEDAIAEGLADDTVLRKVYENISNQHCADCGVENPHWASVNLGIVICKNCAGIHRMFDYRISKIRSLRMDTRVWTPSLVELMVTIGNANANAFWESDLPAATKVQPTELMRKRMDYIFKKYKSRQFCKLHPLANQEPALGELLLDAASHDNVLDMIQILFSGANVLYKKDRGPTAYDVAKEHGQRLIMELLYQNGGDPQFSEQDVTDENRLREDVRMQGYLNKAGPVGRSFEKRWCILEHGSFTYYLNEKSKTFKGSIHRRDMYLIQATENDRIGYSFELSTGLKDNRIFGFSSDYRDDAGEWIRTIGKLMAPVAVMDQVGMIDVKLAGYAFMKESLVDEWRQTFLVFSWRGIYYMNRDLKLDYLDLRKASGIKMQDSSNSYQQTGPCFVISSTGKSVYLQATLTRDTERMYTAFLEAVVSSGPTLIDQALTNENVPVIVEKCITHIYMNGLEEKGLYRVPGQNSRVQALLDEFRKDVWSVCMSAYTVQDTSNALKRFLRELDDSVFGRISYENWINKAGCKDMNNRLMWYKYYLEKMPQVNFNTLKRIVLHLVQVSQHAAVNLMSIANLASCFAPSLMRTAKDNPLLASDCAGKEISIMVDLLSNSDYFFNVNDDERIILNNIRWAEKEIQRKIQENRVSVVDIATTGMLIPVHLMSREGQSVNILVTEEKTAKEAMQYLRRNKIAPKLETYVLHEELFKGALERPIFPEDTISKTTNRWMEFESWVMEDNSVCLCVRGLELLEKLNTHFSPNHALLSKHQYCDSKPKSRFRRRVIGFRQCRLALYSDSQGNSELISWRVEDIIVYLGSIPQKILPPYKYCLTFIVNGEKYTKPSFGHCISFETENELCRWAAALYAAQHPTGLLSWVNE